MRNMKKSGFWRLPQAAGALVIGMALLTGLAGCDGDDGSASGGEEYNVYTATTSVVVSSYEEFKAEAENTGSDSAIVVLDTIEITEDITLSRDVYVGTGTGARAIYSDVVNTRAPVDKVGALTVASGGSLTLNSGVKVYTTKDTNGKAGVFRLGSTELTLKDADGNAVAEWIIEGIDGPLNLAGSGSLSGYGAINNIDVFNETFAAFITRFPTAAKEAKELKDALEATPTATGSAISHKWPLGTTGIPPKYWEISLDTTAAGSITFAIVSIKTGTKEYSATEAAADKASASIASGKITVKVPTAYLVDATGDLDISFKATTSTTSTTGTLKVLKAVDIAAIPAIDAFRSVKAQLTEHDIYAEIQGTTAAPLSYMDGETVKQVALPTEPAISFYTNLETAKVSNVDVGVTTDFGISGGSGYTLEIKDTKWAKTGEPVTISVEADIELQVTVTNGPQYTVKGVRIAAKTQREPSEDDGNGDDNPGDNGEDTPAKPVKLADTATFAAFLAKCDEVIAYCNQVPGAGNNNCKTTAEGFKSNSASLESSWDLLSSAYIKNINDIIELLT